MIYVMSDIHGEYCRYTKMLRKIRFSEEDTLYVLGDVVDRGNASVSILRDMASRDNVIPILGNHEVIAISMLRKLLTEITEDTLPQLDRKLMKNLRIWQADGGATTLQNFLNLDAQERLDLLDYLEDFSPYEVVDVGDRTFVLVHAGLENFSQERPLEDYSPDELLWSRRDPEEPYFDDPSVYVVTGHTPTIAMSGMPEILHCGRNICIDCGASYPGGRLACLCLDTMEEYYV